MTNTTPKVATQIKSAETSRFNGDARFYHLSTPINGESHVIVSAISAAFDTGLPETFIFPAYPTGELKDWAELPGSHQGVYDPEGILTDLGYTIDTSEVN
jgi:hypothetical protein